MSHVRSSLTLKNVAPSQLANIYLLKYYVLEKVEIAPVGGSNMFLL